MFGLVHVNSYSLQQTYNFQSLWSKNIFLGVISNKSHFDRVGWGIYPWSESWSNQFHTCKNPCSHGDRDQLHDIWCLSFSNYSERDKRFSSLFVQKWCFSCFERDFSKYFFANIFLFGANSQNLFRIQWFPHFSYTQKMKTTSPLPAIF